MPRFIPESSLLDNIYVPFYSAPEKRVENCADYFTYLESDMNGVTSVINLVTDTLDEIAKPVVPFIDIRNFDPETKEWYYLDASGYPYRLFSDSSSDTGWVLKTMWPINYINDELTIDTSIVGYTEQGKGLGFYSIATLNGDEINMYPGNPVMVTIDGKTLVDKTVYGTQNMTTGLTTLNSDVNPEFYYDYVNNKIHTNQNLLTYDPKHIKIYFFKSLNEISIKARLASNSGSDAFYTPVVDYYVAKLNGQLLLRG